MSMTEPISDLSVPVWRFSARDWLAVGGLFAVTLALYFRTRAYGFIGYDDPAYVYLNVDIIGGFSLAHLHSALLSTINGNWHPLTTLAWLLIASLLGNDASYFHLTNAVLHGINASLLFGFVKKATGQRCPAFFVAALWALHPQRVESVVWVSELKDCLLGTTWLLCLLSYARFAQARSLDRYLAVVVLFILSMLAKPMAVTLPFVLLLLDYWPLRPVSRQGFDRVWWKARVVEKLPLFALSIADVTIGFMTQKKMHLGASLHYIPMSLRLENALVSYGTYLRDAFWPLHLIFFYPHPAIVEGAYISHAATFAALVLLLAISICVFLYSRRRPYLFVGWFWFLGMLVPVIGLFQSGPQARADRFTYLPFMGLAIAIVWLPWDLVKARTLLRANVIAVMGISVILLAVRSSIDIGYWRDEATLFSHVLEIQPDNFVALSLRSNELRTAGDSNAALVLNERAVAVAPNDSGARVSYALTLESLKRYEEAVTQIRAAMFLNPWDSNGWDAWGSIRSSQREEAHDKHLPGEEVFRQQAITDFRRALKEDPNNTRAGEHLAFQLAVGNQLDEAIQAWEDVLQKAPTYAQAQGDLADALRLKNDLPGAVEHFRAAIAAGSKNPDWESKLAYLVATSPQATRADVEPLLPVAKDAVDQTQSHDAGALDAYAACLARVGRFDDAVNIAQAGIDQANAAHAPLVAAGIQKHLARYRQLLPWTASDK